MNWTRMSITCAILFLLSCSGNTSSEEAIDRNLDETGDEQLDTLSSEIGEVPYLKAKIDTVAMGQIRQYLADDQFESAFDLYVSAGDVIEIWCDKLWGRCCTEADMRLSEMLHYSLTTSVESEKYPFKNALDEDYLTAYVFEPENEVVFRISVEGLDGLMGHYGGHKELQDFVHENDTIMSHFQFSLINGYTKSKTTFFDNTRVKSMEVWLNGQHKCNVGLLDVPEIQMIETTFPLFRDDVVELKPYEYYKGSKYNDVCITELQTNLGYSCHPGIDASVK